MNKAIRLMENMDKADVNTLYSKVGSIDKDATPLKQARFINNVLNMAEDMQIGMSDTMRKCGGCCISANAIKIAKKLYGKSSSIEEFLCFLNEADIGGKHLHLEDGKIIAIYKKCYCNMPKKIDAMNPIYCECSAGWYMKLFSGVFNQKVDVKILDTIVNGGTECTFEITGF